MLFSYSRSPFQSPLQLVVCWSQRAGCKSPPNLCFYDPSCCCSSSSSCFSFCYFATLQNKGNNLNFADSSVDKHFWKRVPAFKNSSFHNACLVISIIISNLVASFVLNTVWRLIWHWFFHSKVIQVASESVATLSVVKRQTGNMAERTFRNGTEIQKTLF